MTSQALAMLAILLSDPLIERHGFDLSDQAGIKSGTLYPLLARFEQAGWLSSRWEDVDPHVVGRPRRRLYTLTAHGAEAAREALNAQIKALSVSRTPTGRGERQWGTA